MRPQPSPARTAFGERTDVQNIDLMNLASFCRNCLSNWYQEAAAERGLTVSKDEARQRVYGMPYEEWKAKYQTEAPPEKMAKYAERTSITGVGPVFSPSLWRFSPRGSLLCRHYSRSALRKP